MSTLGLGFTYNKNKLESALKDYFDTDKTSMSYSEEDMKKAVKYLRESIIDAFVNIQRSEGQNYERLNQITTEVIKSNNGVRAYIRFPADSLFRPSLFRIPDTGGYARRRPTREKAHRPTFSHAYYRDHGALSAKRGIYDIAIGKGAYDIFGLFTKGWKQKKKQKMIRGYWKSRKKIVYGLRNRKGSNFIDKAVKDFEKKYPGITVTYPESWHSK